MRKIRSINEVTKVTDINMNYIQKYIETASAEDIAWIEETYNKCLKNEAKNIRESHPDMNDKEITTRAERQYFGAFRSEFAHKYCTHLLDNGKTKKSENALLSAINKRRSELAPTN